MSPAKARINNHVYDTLGEGWYDAEKDPVALLRAESRLRNPWLKEILLQHFGLPPDEVRVLDVGCGGGFLANYLAESGFSVCAVDRSGPSLKVASRHDRSGKVRYQEADAFCLPYADGAFDAVCAMDFLEHVEDPRAVIAEANRVLRANGLFFFFTHNRNWLSAFFVIKGVSWFVRDTPENLHLYRLFIKPGELRQWCAERDLELSALRGLLCTRSVPQSFEFRFTRSTAISYVGYAVKKGSCGKRSTF